LNIFLRDIINKLLVIERRILRKIFGPKNENRIWRIKTNQELNEIIKHKNIINFIRAQRQGWLGHIEWMQGTRMVKAIYCWKPISRRPIGQAGWMILEKIYRSYKYQTGRLLPKIEEDGKRWLRRSKLCTKSCRATYEGDFKEKRHLCLSQHAVDSHIITTRF
jgi:intein/homing endonuclease